MVETRFKRRRLMSISSNVSPRSPDLPAIFESLIDDTLTKTLQFVGNKSYKSFGGVNKQCREVYLATEGMTKETFVYGYAPLPVIKDYVERSEQFDWELHKRVGKGVVLYNRSDVLEWALQHQKSSLLIGICQIATEEGRIDILNKVWNNVNNMRAKRYIFDVDGHAALHGKLNVLKWIETKGISLDKKKCAREAASYGHLNILKWLRVEGGLELAGELYYHSIIDGHLHVIKWLKEQGCPWKMYLVREEDLKPEVVEWLRANECSDRILLI